MKKLEDHFKEDVGSVIPKNDNHFLDDKKNFKFKKKNLDDIMNEINNF